MVKVSPKTKKVSFQITLPEADSVYVVGDFNGWSGDATPLKKGRGGVWKTDVKVESGDYQFRYLVNRNEWVNDDEAPAVPNQFGSHNSVIHVEYPAAKPAAKKPAAKKATAKKSSNGKAK